jgi:hypothetical protein
MSGSPIRRFAIPAATLGIGLVAGAGTVLSNTTSAQGAPATPKNVAATYLTASLLGRNEIPGDKGLVGDPNGRAVEVIRIKGDQVSYAIRWQAIAAPTEAHVHLGATGVNGPVKVDFFGSGIPGTANAAVGTVTVKDKALLSSLTSNPGGFYANLHTAAFPGGAVRGQLHRLSHAVDLNAVLRNGPLVSLDSGDQEIPAQDGKATGAPDAHGTGLIGIHSGRLDYSFTWSGLTSPTAGHIHQGVSGTDGPVVAPLFASPNGLPASLTGLAGTVTDLPPRITQQVTADPGGFYTNLHTARFPGGALRGQLFDGGGTQPAAFTDSVVNGVQIYACIRQPNGGYAFTQHDVRADLQNGIHHSFVAPDAGPPQWVAADGSSVTGKVITKTPNGSGNIPELDLTATQTGRSTGLLSGTAEVMRLNTVGGVAPAGACDPQSHPTVEVPYKADYLFIAQ